MKELKILNKKEIKKILILIKEQWGSKLDSDYGFLISPKNKIYIIEKDFSMIDSSKLRINNIGMYLGELSKHDELRLSIEGAQLVGKNANKGIIEFNNEQTKEWFRGVDVEFDGDSKGFVILKHGVDFLGCGKHTKGKILNYVPKARRAELII